MEGNAEKYLFNEYAEMRMAGNVIYITYKKGIVSNISVGRKIFEDRLALCGGIPHFVHGDCRGIKYWTEECRDFSNSKENLQLIIAGTVVYTNSHVANIVINFFLKFNKPPFPVKFCTSEKEALEWLSKFKEFRKE